MIKEEMPFGEPWNSRAIDDAMMVLCAVDPEDHPAARRALQAAIHAVTLELASHVPLYLPEQE